MTVHSTQPHPAEPLPSMPPELKERLLVEIECGVPATAAEVAETENLLLSCHLLPPTELQMHRMREAVQSRSYRRTILTAAAAVVLLALPAALLLGNPAQNIPLRPQTYIISDPADGSEILIQVKQPTVAVSDDII